MLKRIGLSIFSWVVMVTMMGSGLGGMHVPKVSAAAYTAVVNPSVQFQTWEGWGTTLAWWAHRVGGASDSVRNDYADRLFSTSGLNFNIVRYNIGGGENPAYPNHMDLRARIPGFKASSTASYDWTADANQRWVLNAAKSRINASEFIAEAFANSPPWWMTKSGSVTGNNNADENLKVDMYDDFADYLTTVTQHFQSSWGVNFRTLSAFNEPSSNYWTFGNRQEGNRMYPANQQIMIGELYNSLTAKGITTGISAPEETSIDLARDTINSYSAATKAKLVQYNSHTYGGSDRVGLNTAAGGKRIWNSEHGDGEANGITMSRNILWDIKYMKNAAWVYWQAVETPGGWGMIETDLNNASANLGTFTVKKKYYSMAQWSKYIRPGYKILDIADGDSIAAYDSTGSKLVIVTVNDSSASNTVTYDLSQFTNVTGSVTGTRTSGTENLAAVSGLALSNKKFTATVPAGSVSTFVITGVSGTSTPTIDTSAYYKLVNRNSGKLMDVSQGSQSDGADVIQWGDNGGMNQMWQFVSVGSGYYKLVNRNSGKVLDVSGQSTADGGNIIQNTSGTGLSQQWQPVLVGSYYKLINRNSGKLADVSGASTSDGGDVIQYFDNGGTNQQWQLVKVN
ncbi:RICIN domain-containing protein [Paenibacillus sp. CF384]|uniref:RICIN domain-containing protein n=1 Tax=Paenibacillus sp. CF384 TaxID=1884382 RepID=UPI00089C5873|nr:RICIN domain-containing protein [Paenibacillus sp. CF384]SDX94259.1 galactan endo-1,6-beta-galactosidase [Paenibacillus sp. CF384]